MAQTAAKAMIAASLLVAAMPTPSHSQAALGKGQTGAQGTSGKCNAPGQIKKGASDCGTSSSEGGTAGGGTTTSSGGGSAEGGTTTSSGGETAGGGTTSIGGGTTGGGTATSIGGETAGGSTEGAGGYAVGSSSGEMANGPGYGLSPSAGGYPQGGYPGRYYAGSYWQGGMYDEYPQPSWSYYRQPSWNYYRQPSWSYYQQPSWSYYQQPSWNYYRQPSWSYYREPSWSAYQARPVQRFARGRVTNWRGVGWRGGEGWVARWGWRPRLATAGAATAAVYDYGYNNNYRYGDYGYAAYHRPEAYTVAPNYSHIASSNYDYGYGTNYRYVDYYGGYSQPGIGAAAVGTATTSAPAFLTATQNYRSHRRGYRTAAAGWTRAYCINAVHERLGVAGRETNRDAVIRCMRRGPMAIGYGRAEASARQVRPASRRPNW